MSSEHRSFFTRFLSSIVDCLGRMRSAIRAVNVGCETPAEEPWARWAVKAWLRSVARDERLGEGKISFTEAERRTQLGSSEVDEALHVQILGRQTATHDT